MARLPRLAIDRQVHHLVHRAAPGIALLGSDAERDDFVGALADASRDADIAVHAYAMLPDRIQLLLTPQRGVDLAPMMQRLGRRFVAAYNQRHRRSGSPWAGRYRATVLQASRLLAAIRHVEVLPVRAGLVERADQWRASSAAHHFGFVVDPVVTEHPFFWTLGNTPFDRAAAYRRFCAVPSAESRLAELDAATDKGWAFGDADFIAELSASQARRLQPKPRGRPKRAMPTGNNLTPI